MIIALTHPAIEHDLTSRTTRTERTACPKPKYRYDYTMKDLLPADCGFDLHANGEIAYSGQTTTGTNETGRALAWQVSAPAYALTVLDVRWANGERDVRAAAVQKGRLAIQHLAQGNRRLGIYEIPQSYSWAEMRMSRIKGGSSNEWTTTVDANEAAWTEVFGANWIDRIQKNYGVQIGTKAELLGCDDRTRYRLCVKMHTSQAATVVPAIFVLTRVVPPALGLTR